MTDRERWSLRGPVRLLREEFAELDFTTERWLPPRHYSITVFLRDGRLDQTEFHHADRSVVQSVYRYDSSGRLADIRTGDSVTTHIHDDAGRLARVTCRTGDLELFRYEADGSYVKVQLVPPEMQARNVMFGCGAEGSHSYSCRGAAEVHTLYDASGRAIEMRFLNSSGKLLNQVVFSYDSAGRLLREAQVAGGAAFGGLPGRLLARLAGLRGEMSSVEYQYDPEGHRVAVHNRLGKVMDERVTWRYDRFGSKIEETREKVAREMTFGLTGMKIVSERRSRHHVRLEYQYDEHGNWTEQVVSTRPEPNPNFQPQNILRRQLTYW